MALTYLIPCILFLLYTFLFYKYHNAFISSLKANLLLFRGLTNVHRIHDWFVENLSVTGSLYGRAPWPSGMAFFVTCDPANAHHIFTQNFQNYPKGDDFTEIFEPFGDGFVNTDGEIWRYHRQKLKLVMSRKAFRAFIAETTQEKIRNSLFPFLLKAVDLGVTIDLQDMFSRLISDTSNVLIFGTDTGSLSIDLPDVPFVRAVDDTTATMFSRVSTPSSWWKFCKFLRIGQEKKLARALVVMDHFIAEVIERRKQELIEGNNNLACHDLLSSYMSDEDRPIKSTKFLRDIVLSLLLASRDTMTAGLSWFFWTLSQNKQAEEKILLELRSIHHEVTPEGMITFDIKDLENLVYFKAAFMESLRLHPPIPLNFKTVLKPDQLPSGFTVTPGMKVMVSAYTMGRMQDIWGKDCLEFKPERWISDKGTLTHVPSYRYLVFHAGPRSCLGENMALAQMRMVAAVMLYNFCFEVAEGHTVEPTLSIVLHMKNGLRMRIRRRVN